MQIFNNLNAKTCEKSKSFDLKVATPGPRFNVIMNLIIYC